MKVAVFTLFTAALFLISRRAAETPLAYFVFFPVGITTLYYFYGLRQWIFILLTGALLLGFYFFTPFGAFLEEGLALVGVGLSSFALLVYHEQMWIREAREAEKRSNQAQAEFRDLKQRHGTRVESLLHLEKQVASLINLFEIARDFNECLDFKETAQILFKKVLPELSFERAELVILNTSVKPSVISKAYVISRSGVEVKGEAATDGVEREWLKRASGEKGVCVVGGVWLFPLVLEGELNGLLCIQGSEKEDLAKFEVLASQLALQVRKVSLYEMVRELSIIDGLTGVFVRRHFLERFEEEIRRAIKYGFPLSVLMLDIDHFKRYNDEFGHLVGDATLREVSGIIRANVRNVDIVSRYGGEEFAVVIPETKEEGALEVAERIRSAVARRSFRVYDEETKVTVSLGVSAFPRDLGNPNPVSYEPGLIFELLQKADRALYRAKEEGRNRIVLYRSLA